MSLHPIATREIAHTILKSALKAVDPKEAVRNYFHYHPEIMRQIQATRGRLIVVGAGKGSAPMAVAIHELFKSQLTAGLIIVKYGHGLRSPMGISPLEIVEAGHPVPDTAGVTATRALTTLLNQTTAEDTVICLISGGGSALMTMPAAGLTLADIQQSTEALLAAGATINQVNVIRKHLSAVKGGQLAQLAAPARVYALILSDVVGDPLEVIASGSTVPDPTTFGDAWNIVRQFELEDRLPKSVLQRLYQGMQGMIEDTPKPGSAHFERVHNAIIGSNRIAAQAALKTAKANGFEAQLLTTFMEGEAREVGKMLAALAKSLHQNEGALKPPACFIIGGETTVTLRGKGQGGRNQEAALAAAIALAGWSNCLVVCFGTDGNDGPTDAAGAFADGDTVAKAEALGLQAVDYLQRNDAYNFFSMLDDLILTGPTHTNVNDLMLVMAW